MITCIVSLAILLNLYRFGQLSQGITVYAEVDQTEHIYVGQRFTYQIIIDGYNKPGQVNMNSLAPFYPVELGNRDVSHRSTQIINGRVYQQSITRLIMSYSLQVNEPGTVTIPPVDVTIEGKVYRTNPVQVNILRPGTTDKLVLEVQISEPNCYVGQPLVLSVRLLIAPDADVSGVEFNIPALLDQRLVLDDPQDIPSQARQARVCGNVAAYVWQGRTEYRDRPWNYLAFKKIIIPQESGLLELGKCTASVGLAIGVESAGSLFDRFGLFGVRTRYQRFAVTSGPLTLNVRPLPQAGRPDGFYGLVGRYKITATARPTEVCVGDPITLTITISGNPYLVPVQWPQLDAIPEMAQNFKIPTERASPITSNGQKVFTQTIRAISQEVTRIPPIQLPYFDPGSCNYVVAQTDPIPLRVMPTKILTGRDIATRQADTPVTSQIEAIRQGLAANYEDPGALIDRLLPGMAVFTSPVYLLTWLGPLTALGVSLAVKLATSTGPNRQAARRRRRAAGHAVRQLKAAALAKDPVLAAEALRRFVADRFDRNAASLTASDCGQVIFEFTGAPDLADGFQALMARLDEARYSPQDVSTLSDDWLKTATDLINQVERSLRR